MKSQKANSYKKSLVETTDQLSLIIMLYDKAILLLENARKEISEKKYVEKHHSLARANDIVFELVQSLDKDKGGKIADLLSRLYAFVIHEIMVADAKKNIKALDNAKTILSELRKSWKDIRAVPVIKTQDAYIPETSLDSSG